MHNNPQCQQILSLLLDGPQRSSLLKRRFGLGVHHTISLLRLELPQGYRINGRWQSIETKFGVIVDYVYHLTRDLCD